MDAGAVAGLAVGVDRAAVPDRLQRLDAGLDHVAPRLAVDAPRPGRRRRRRARARGRRPRGAQALDVRVVGRRRTRRRSRAKSAMAASVRLRRQGRPRVGRPLASGSGGCCAAASRPSRIAQTTSEAPRTMSPAANTPSQAGHHGAVVDLERAPAGDRRARGSPNSAGRSSGSKPSALITRSASSGEVGCRDRLRRLPAGGVGQAEMHAHGARTPVDAVRRRGRPRGAESQTNSTPSSSALLHLAHASPACWRGRGGRGTSPTSRPGGRRCARSPSRCRRRRSRRRACRRAFSVAAVELRHVVAQALAVATRSR